MPGTFEETAACRECDFLEECRKEKQPQRVSCWIRFCRDRYWKPMLETEEQKHERVHH